MGARPLLRDNCRGKLLLCPCLSFLTFKFRPTAQFVYLLIRLLLFLALPRSPALRLPSVRPHLACAAKSLAGGRVQGWLCSRPDYSFVAPQRWHPAKEGGRGGGHANEPPSSFPLPLQGWLARARMPPKELEESVAATAAGHRGRGGERNLPEN